MESLEAKKLMWRDIREGLRLRQIIYSKRINEQNKVTCGGTYQNLIIQRQLGFKEIMPNSG